MTRLSPYRMSANQPMLGSKGKSKPERNDRAWKAVQEMRKLIPTFQTFARQITGDNKVKIQITPGSTRTDGQTIFIKPPIELGSSLVHVARLCDKRGVNKRKLCAACDAREITLWRLYHEVGHIAFGSMVPASNGAIDSITALIEEWHPAAACSHGHTLRDNLFRAKMQKVGAIGVASVHNNYLPLIVNSLEDARVDALMISARPGLRAMLNTFFVTVFEQGTEQPNGDIVFWTDQPAPMQAIVGAFILASGLQHEDIDGYLAPEILEMLRDEKITNLCLSASSCTDSNEILELSIALWRRLQDFGLLRIQKCEIPPPPEPAPPSDDSTEQKNEQTESGDSDDAEQSPMGNPGDSPSKSSETTPEKSDEKDGSESENSPESPDSESESGSASADEEGEEEQNNSSSGSEDKEKLEEDSQSEKEEDPGNSDGDGSSGSALPDGGAGSGSESGSESDDESDDNSADDRGSDSSGGIDEGAEEQPSDNSSGGSQSGDNDDEGNSSVEDSADAGDPAPLTDNSGGVGTGENERTHGSGGGSGNSEPGESLSSPELADDNASDESDEDSADASAEGEYSDGLGDEDGDDGIADDRKPVDASVWDEPIPEKLKFDPDDWASSDDLEAAVEAFTGHGHNEIIGNDFVSFHRDREMNEADQPVGRGPFGNEEANEDGPWDSDTGYLDSEAVRLAVSQSVWFDRSSVNIAGVDFFEFPNEEVNWEDEGYYQVEHFMPTEAIIGKALMQSRIVFAANRRSKKEADLKSGKINTKKLATRAPLGDDRLFYKNNVPGKRDYFVVIGLDCSGSTQSMKRIERIKRAAMAKAELLTRLGVPFAMFAHTGYRRLKGKTVSGRGRNRRVYEDREDDQKLYILNIKQAHEPWNNKTRNKLAQLQPVAQNFDGHTLEFYRKIAEQSRATDKAIIYYTDGEMPAANHDEELEILQREIKYCKQKKIALFAVGINTDSPLEHGFDTVKVESDEDLDLVVKQLGRLLHTS